MDYIYRERRYFHNYKFCSWYECYPVISVTTKSVVVSSIDLPETPLYLGGTFHLNRKQLETTGKAYHSRHGEYFYVEAPSQGDLFPSVDLLSTSDWVTLEARAIGWDTDVLVYEWLEWQRNCWLVAQLLKMPLRQVINDWKSGNLPELWRLVRERNLSN